MGLIEALASLLMGERNVVRETLEVFRENAETGAARDADRARATLAQFAAEFHERERSGFDRVMDALNRLPRPALALGTLALFVAAMIDPVWFAARMQGLAVVPEPLWWLMGAVVSFYFGARYQAKGQEFQRSLLATMARAGQVAANIEALRELDRRALADDNQALSDWRRSIGK